MGFHFGHSVYWVNDKEAEFTTVRKVGKTDIKITAHIL
jgi:hypothetical protein